MQTKTFTHRGGAYTVSVCVSDISAEERRKVNLSHSHNTHNTPDTGTSTVHAQQPPAAVMHKLPEFDQQPACLRLSF